MMLRNLTAERNPYLVTTLSTFSYIIVYSIVRYVRSREFSIAEVLLGAVIFWVLFFLIQHWFLKRLKKK